MLKNLPKIEDEDSFKRKEISHKVKIRPITNEVTKSKYINKKDWFKPQKVLINMNYEKILYHNK